MLIITLVGCPLGSWAQFSESFNDLDNWLGQVNKFEILENQLHLNDQASTGAAYLSRSSSVGINATWEVTARLAFAPSAANNLEFILMSDQEDLSTYFSGYYLQIGENGSADALKFYRKDEVTSTQLSRGIEGRFGTELDSFKIRVNRIGTGNWTIESDIFDGNGYQIEGNFRDSTYLTAEYVGLKCNYTSTRNDRFYFDNLVVTGEEFRDNTPPFVVRFEVVSDSSVSLFFNEALDTSAISLSNFTIASLNPNSIVKNPSEITLDFPPFISDQEQILNLQNIPDLAANLFDTVLTFNYHQNQPFDILITEIMVDPTPVVALPEAEYIELYNSTSVPLNLENWVLSDSSSHHLLPNLTLQPSEYVLLTSNQTIGLFNDTINKIGIADLFTLNNSGDQLTLIDPNELLIHELSYTNRSYNNNLKEEGGYSLELTDLDKVCAGNLLQASNSQLGGTPGFMNSTPDSDRSLRPKIIDFSHTKSEATLLFNSDRLEGLSERNHYILNSDTIQSVLIRENRVVLTFENALEEGELFSLEIQNIQNCLGESLDTAFQLLIAPRPQKGDLVISEILFDPFGSASDYIEIHNQSSLVLSLANVLLINIHPSTSEIIQTRTLPGNTFLTPDQYYVLAPDPESVLNNYQVEYPSNLIETPLISLNNDQGNLALTRLDSSIIDQVYYNQNFHSQLLNNTEGVSLERISLGEPARDESNWFSAPQSLGYGSPTSLNGNQPNHSTGNFELERPNISPDGDGFEDDVFLLYNDQAPGTSLTIKLFTANGQLIRTITENHLIETNGRFRIEGVHEMTALQAGIYVLSLEISSQDGKVNYKRMALTVNRRF